MKSIKRACVYVVLATASLILGIVIESISVHILGLIFALRTWYALRPPSEDVLSGYALRDYAREIFKTGDEM